MLLSATSCNILFFLRFSDKVLLRVAGLYWLKHIVVQKPRMRPAERAFAWRL